MKNLFFLVGAIALGTACNTSDTASGTLERYFKEVPAPDTLLFELAEDGGQVPGDTIPVATFLDKINDRLLNDIPFFDTTGDLTILGGQRFPVAENVEAFEVHFFQNWFQNQSLFLFDKNKNAITGRITAAEFYGGDGGQILTGSWLFDYNGDGDPDLVRTEIEHWINLSSDEPAEKVEQRVSLLLWNGGGFTESEVLDSAALMQAFPVKSWW
ncbi:MAG: hypothetical protein ACE5FF_08505 [Saprospiraceae bacterium]